MRFPLNSNANCDSDELTLNCSVKLGLLILLLNVSVAASQEPPNKTLTLTWDASPKSEKVTGYRVYELVKSREVLIGQSNTQRKNQAPR